ncbi:kinase [Agrobacterium deltaense]|uniref:GHMP family kinase ATP-binding protein n=1 Tax=Agrobacterium deltaense TaxID=1183412 RepID=UPI001C6EE5EC|nr:kinase [Agrobacterium deltaense]MBW9075664.1 kinase [Agrobacterium deltaense]
MSFSNCFPFDSRTHPEHNFFRSLRVGVGRAIAHHGEVLQGVFADETGRLHRGLLTLPCRRGESIATFWPDDGKDIRTRPAGRSKAARAAALAFQELGHSHAGGSLTIETSIPVGCGYGSSTADVVAAIRAAAAAAGAELRKSAICRLAVTAETASDAIVFGEHAVLFAHREGAVLEYFPGEYPPLHVVGFVSRDDAPVDTLTFTPARYDSSEIESFRVLRGLVRHAIRKQDARLLGHVATVSAHINQRHLPKQHFEDLLSISATVGGCGVQVAHSGNLMGILLDANDPDAVLRAQEAAAAARDCGFTDIVRFSVNVDGAPLWG